MPVWLATFLTKLIEPIVEKLIAKLMLDSRLKSLEEKQNQMNSGFMKLAGAQSDQEMKDALNAIASSWNH